MKDVVKRDDIALHIVARNDEATDSLMQQSLGANVDLPGTLYRRHLRNLLLLANIVAWIGIIILIRWLHF